MGETQFETGPIGCIGIGDMGFAIARTILDAGFDVRAFDIRREALDEFESIGGHAAESVSEIVESCRSVHIVVVNDEQANEVMYGDDGVFAACEANPSETLVVIHSTILPETVVDFSENAPPGVTVIDAAVSGGQPRAIEGDLALMVGGGVDTVEYYEPVLDVIAREIFHLGPVGAGLATKLANNAVLHAAEAATYEALEVGEAYGVDEDQLVEVFRNSSGNNFIVQQFEFMANERFYVHPAGGYGPARNAKKNLKQALSLADSLDVEVPLIGHVSQAGPKLLKERAHELDAVD